MRIKDIARAASVSTATVSNVINNTRHVSDVTRARVLEAIARHSYYPNEHARSLARGRSTTLGLIVSDISNPFFPELVKSIEMAAFERGYDVMLANTNYDAGRTSNYVRRFIERKVAGVALMTSELDASLLDELTSRHVSVVFLDIGHAHEHMSNIVVNYGQGIGEAVRHLCELDHRRIAFIGGPSRLRSARKRLQAFRSSLADCLHGVESLIYEGDFQLEGGRLAARRMLQENEGKLPTAVIVANDMMALGVMRECREAGLNIPQDISIIGFDDIAFAALTDPPLTTVRLPRDELGTHVVAALIDPLERNAEPHVETHLVVRNSTARARQREPS